MCPCLRDSLILASFRDVAWDSKKFYGRSDKVSLCIVGLASCWLIIGQVTKVWAIKTGCEWEESWHQNQASANWTLRPEYIVFVRKNVLSGDVQSEWYWIINTTTFHQIKNCSHYCSKLGLMKNQWNNNIIKRSTYDDI